MVKSKPTKQTKRHSDWGNKYIYFHGSIHLLFLVLEHLAQGKEVLNQEHEVDTA